MEIFQYILWKGKDERVDVWIIMESIWKKKFDKSM